MNKTNAVDVSTQAVSPLFMSANAGYENILKKTINKKFLVKLTKLEKQIIITP